MKNLVRGANLQEMEYPEEVWSRTPRSTREESRFLSVEEACPALFTSPTFLPIEAPFKGFWSESSETTFLPRGQNMNAARENLLSAEESLDTVATATALFFTTRGKSVPEILAYPSLSLVLTLSS